MYYINSILESLNHIGQSYFKLQTINKPSGIVRERVFCYEFYHQLRNVLGNSHSIVLHGEIDKSGHPDFSKEYQRNPDLILHSPGEHTYNTVVCEVKGKIIKSGISKDFNTLVTFINQYNYKYGVFILYNHSLTEFTTKMQDSLSGFGRISNTDRIFVITIEKAGAARIVKLSEAFEN